MEGAEAKDTSLPDLTNVPLEYGEETPAVLAEALRLLLQRLDLQQETLSSFNASLS
ncbi:hypothetical protein GCM10009727_48030 [Actinomadura napierensis]|uniref:FXSXX-COOH protein n=1 Tax=Actinomadura napierensis TaxID=267854 RepID=A0ABN2ZSQ2_9ACTN